ncbi:hypothetical protein Tco_0549669, partial [Tanacetum coccineum]
CQGYDVRACQRGLLKGRDAWSEVDTAYESSWIRHIGLYIFMVPREVQAQIRRIFLDGYGVLDVKSTDS